MSCPHKFFVFFYLCHTTNLQTTRKDMYYTVKLVENQIDYQKPLDNQVDKLNDLAYTKDTRLTIIDKDGNVVLD